MSSFAERLAGAWLPEDLEALLNQVEEGADVGRDLVARYRDLAARPRRDPDCRLRWLLLSALRRRAQPGDADLLEDATRVYEYLPSQTGPVEMAHGIRAAGLLALHELDPERARWRALDLLAEGKDNAQSGDPSRAAIRVLGVLGETALLDAVARHHAFGLEPAARAEALLWLGGLPQERLRGLVDTFAKAGDDAFHLAVVDLALRADDEWLAERAVAMLAATAGMEVFRYAVLQAVALRRPDVVDALRASADRPRAELLAELA